MLYNHQQCTNFRRRLPVLMFPWPMASHYPHQGYYIQICDPLWEKVQFCANNEFELCMNIAVQVKLQVYPLFGMKGNYDPLPCSYRWTDSDPTILEPAAPCQNCTVDISTISARSVTEQIPRSTSTNTTRCTSPTYCSDFIEYLRLFCTPYIQRFEQAFRLHRDK